MMSTLRHDLSKRDVAAKIIICRFGYAMSEESAVEHGLFHRAVILHSGEILTLRHPTIDYVAFLTAVVLFFCWRLQSRCT